MTIFKPMLASTLEPDMAKKLSFPMFGSYKIDGIRCITFSTGPVSRTMKPIPNAFIRSKLCELFSSLGEGCFVDGELITGSSFQEATSGIMSRDGEPKFSYYLFDYVRNGDTSEPFCERIKNLRMLLIDLHRSKAMEHLAEAGCSVEILEQFILFSEEELEEFENAAVQDGQEGVMLRSMGSPYKYGRATAREGYLMKLKRFTTTEAEIIGYECKYKNLNEATVNVFGRTERSSHKDNLEPLEELGAFIVRDAAGVTYNVGSGYTQKQREDFWRLRESMVGQWLSIKFFDFNIKDKPRHPVFLGVRHSEDMS
jgi:DNA ligase-1